MLNGAGTTPASLLVDAWLLGTDASGTPTDAVDACASGTPASLLVDACTPARMLADAWPAMGRGRGSSDIVEAVDTATCETGACKKEAGEAVGDVEEELACEKGALDACEQAAGLHGCSKEDGVDAIDWQSEDGSAMGCKEGHRDVAAEPDSAAEEIPSTVDRAAEPQRFSLTTRDSDDDEADYFPKDAIDPKEPDGFECAGDTGVASRLWTIHGEHGLRPAFLGLLYCLWHRSWAWAVGMLVLVALALSSDNRDCGMSHAAAAAEQQSLEYGSRHEGVGSHGVTQRR